MRPCKCYIFSENSDNFKHLGITLLIEFSDDRLQILPLVQENLRPGVLYLLEHLVVLEAPVNKISVHYMSPKKCSGQSLSLQITFPA